MMLYVRVTNKDTQEILEWDWIRGRSAMQIVIRVIKRLYRWHLFYDNAVYEIETRVVGED